MTRQQLRRIVNSLLDILLSILTWIVVAIPLILVIVIPLLSIRLVVDFLAWICRPDLIKVTKFADAVLTIIPSCNEPGLNASQIWRVRGKLNVEEFRKHFYNCFLSTDELRQKYVNLSCCIVQWMLYCFKKPLKTIDLEEHIREHVLEPGVTLEDFVGKWMAKGTYGSRDGKMDGEYKEVPDWQILIVHNPPMPVRNCGDGLDLQEESVLLFKINHCLTDGYTFVHLVEKLSGIKAPYNYKETKMSLYDTMKLVLTGPKLLLGYLVPLACSPDLLYPPKNPNPREWFISFATLDLQLIKNIRRQTKTHFNCVIKAALVGALRRHFLETSRVSKVSELPVNCYIGCPLAWPDHPAMNGGGMTNHLTGGSFQVPLRADNPIQRLLLAEGDYNRFHKLFLQKLVYYVVFGFLWTVPANINRFARQHANFGIMRNSIYVSPLMCSSQPYQLMGLSVEHLYLPLLVRSLDDSTTMFVIPVSHSGKVDLTINASSEVIKGQEDLDRFTKLYFVQELERLDAGVI